MQYAPYGTVITNTLPVTLTDRLFTGQRFESDLGLHDYRARFYDPLVGSFISADTVVPEVGSPRGWNRYGCGYNNPVKFRDPSGHCGERYAGNESCWEKYKQLKRICPECTSHRTAEGEDIPLERLNETQLDNLVQGLTGEYNRPTPPSGDGMAELILLRAKINEQG